MVEIKYSLLANMRTDVRAYMTLLENFENFYTSPLHALYEERTRTVVLKSILLKGIRIFDQRKNCMITI